MSKIKMGYIWVAGLGSSITVMLNNTCQPSKLWNIDINILFEKFAYKIKDNTDCSKIWIKGIFNFIPTINK